MQFSKGHLAVSHPPILRAIKILSISVLRRSYKCGRYGISKGETQIGSEECHLHPVLIANQTVGMQSILGARLMVIKYKPNPFQKEDRQDRERAV